MYLEQKIATEVKANPKVCWRYIKSKMAVTCFVQALTSPDIGELVDDAVGQAGFIVFMNEDLTSFVCKISECFVKAIIFQHRICNNFLTFEQYGVVTFRSWVLQLIDAFDD